MSQVLETEYGLHLTQALRELSPGVHSRAWLANTDDGDWVVKISLPNGDSQDRLALQSEVYAFLNELGLRTPVVRPDLRGRCASAVTEEGVQHPVTLMLHHPLRRLNAQSVSAAEMIKLGSMIARLHVAMNDFARSDVIIADRTKSDDEWGRHETGVYEELVAAPTARCLTVSELSRIGSVDREIVAYLDANREMVGSLTFAILHGDLSFEHIQLLPNGEPYVFDFGDMSWGPVSHEIGQLLLGCRVEPIRFTRWAGLRRWVLGGYARVHVLSDADVEAIDYFILNRVIGASQYILELSGDAASSSGGETIKCLYDLAEDMLAGRHLE